MVVKDFPLPRSRVFSKQRCTVHDRFVIFRKTDRTTESLYRAQQRMLDLGDHVAGDCLQTYECLAHAPNRCVWDVVLIQDTVPIRHGRASHC